MMNLQAAIFAHRAGVTRPFPLRALMCAQHVTIRALAATMQITHRRVRDVRNGAPVSPLAEFDFREGVAQTAAGRVRA